MPRVVKEHEYLSKRNEILDAGRRLVETKGYEPMTIQDILDEAHISRGAFYHYFDSKQALLEGIVDRMFDIAEDLIAPIIDDPQRPALAKFQKLFADLGRWKTEQKSFVLALLRVWYTDDNALLRHKVRRAMVRRVGPALAIIVAQGMQEGVFTAAYPDEVGEVALSLLQDLSDSLAGLLLTCHPAQDNLPRIERLVATYTDALERVLGAASGSLQIVDALTLREWAELVKGQVETHATA